MNKEEFLVLGRLHYNIDFVREIFVVRKNLTNYGVDLNLPLGEITELNFLNDHSLCIQTIFTKKNSAIFTYRKFINLLEEGIIIPVTAPR